MKPVMMDGSMLIKGRKIAEDGDSYYLEFYLNEAQTQGLLASLILEGGKDALRKLPDTESESLKRAKFIDCILKENHDMLPDLRNQFLQRMLELFNE
jgi:hypothetical protein